LTHSHIINIDNFSSYPINDNHFKSSSSLNLICQWDPTRFRTSPRLSSCEVLVVLKTLWRPIEPVFMCCYLLHVVTLTGYNPLLCFTCTLSEMFHQFRPSNLKPWDMLRRPKTYRKHIIPGHPKTTKNPYFLDGFLRVSTARIRVFYGLAKVELFPKRVEKRSFRIALRDSTGFLRVWEIQLSGHHEHDESWNDWSLGLIPRFLALYCSVVDIIDGTN